LSYDDILKSLDEFLAGFVVRDVYSMIIPEENGKYTIVIFDRDVFDVLHAAMNESILTSDIIRIEFRRYRGLKIPIFIIKEMKPYRMLTRLKLYVPRDEHLFILRCSTGFCERDPMIVEMVKRGMDWKRLIDDTIRITEVAYRDKSRIIPAFEVYKAIEEIVKSGIDINIQIFKQLLEVSYEYILQRIWYLDTH